jgi:hypothetical protein
MSLTREVEQRLEKADLFDLFDAHKASYQMAAQEVYDLLEKNFSGAAVRRDDVAKGLKPIIEVNEDLQTHLSTKKLTQKYWIQNFTDLIIDRVWDDIT